MRSRLSLGDVSNTIDNLLEIIPKYLLMGKSVNLGGLSTFRLLFSSNGVAAYEAFNTNLIKGVKVVFTPSSEQKSALEKISFEKA